VIASLTAWVIAIAIFAIPVVLFLSITVRHVVRTARIVRGRE
jgi:hypothetical protein